MSVKRNVACIFAIQFPVYGIYFQVGSAIAAPPFLHQAALQIFCGKPGLPAIRAKEINSNVDSVNHKPIVQDCGEPF
jgi:hypothetical protein